MAKPHLFELKENTITFIQGNEETKINIPDIKVISIISNGANGQVFKAIDELEREVAVKVWFNKGTGESLEKAKKETQKLSKFSNSPLFVYVHRFGMSEGFPYAVMELVNGETGKEHIKRTPYDFWINYSIWRMLFFSLFPMYEKGILHGDPHLGNILIINDSHRIYEGYQKDRITTEYDSKRELKQVGIKITDFGTSAFREEKSFEIREKKVILETAKRLFKNNVDFSIVNISNEYNLSTLLDCIDACIDFTSKVKILLDVLGENVNGIHGDNYVLVEDMSHFLITRAYFDEEKLIAYMYKMNLGEMVVNLVIGLLPRSYLKHFHSELNDYGLRYAEIRMDFKYAEHSSIFKESCIDGIELAFEKYADIVPKEYIK